VATVSGTGLRTAQGPGTATITATSEGKSGSGTVTVTATPVATVSVALGSTSIQEGATTSATATVRNGNGIVLNGRTVTWSSSNAAVATVSSTGEVTARSAGTATITGTSEARSGSATLTVTALPVGEVVVSLASSSVDEQAGTTAAAVVRSTSGTVLTGRTIAWSSSNTSVATVSASGAVTTLRAGTVTITGATGGRSGAATLVVRELPVVRLTVTPSQWTVTERGSPNTRTKQLVATVYGPNDRVLAGRTITWTSSRPSEASVSSSGLVRGEREGFSIITASTGGRSATARIDVEEDDD
jgi:uncharacterized protein YjdB